MDVSIFSYYACYFSGGIAAVFYTASDSRRNIWPCAFIFTVMHRCCPAPTGGEGGGFPCRNYAVFLYPCRGRADDKMAGIKNHAASFFGGGIHYHHTCYGRDRVRGTGSYASWEETIG